jgi:hypothetical protein
LRIIRHRCRSRILGTPPTCARAASGHPAAAPPLYLYVDFGDIDAVGPVSGSIAPLIPGAAVSYHADLTANIVRVGLNYRF